MAKPIIYFAFTTILVGFFGLWASAQNGVTQSNVPMADGLRADGKIYVVVAVLLTILAGLFVYVVRLDKKISKLEKDSTNL